ncbi:MAG: YqaA family protein [Pyrinomonadaceae bacterium]
MHKLILKIIATLAGVSKYLFAYGAFGLFAISLLDSALVPLPAGSDATMILLSASRPSWMILYAVAGIVGSVIGCVILYYISRSIGSGALKRFSPEKQAWVKSLVDRYDLLSVLIASILPPPFPFKLFVVTAGVTGMNVVRFLIAITAGRLFRFLLEGYLAVQYGARARELLARYYPIIGVTLSVLILILFLVYSLSRRRQETVEG